ncbi:MAG: hypothetical protein ACE5EA_09785 [Nitrospirota bacterium]
MSLQQGRKKEYVSGNPVSNNRGYSDNNISHNYRYEISLSGQDLSHVIGAFAWIATRDANPDGLTFYIDDVRYE